MKKPEWVCFFIMPFDEKLHYFSLYLKQHIETNYHLRVVRADEQVLTKPVLDKISDMIKEAEVIVADCSDLRPNDFPTIQQIARWLSEATWIGDSE